jgi:hypothetical protein
MKLSLLNRNSWKKKYRIGIVYFADGSIVNKVAAWRLYLQIYRSRIVTTIGAYNLSRINHKLTSEDKKFISKHRNNRGYGYWLWKPLIILDFLEKFVLPFCYDDNQKFETIKNRILISDRIQYDKHVTHV